MAKVFVGTGGELKLPFTTVGEDPPPNPATEGEVAFGVVKKFAFKAVADAMSSPELALPGKVCN